MPTIIEQLEKTVRNENAGGYLHTGYRDQGLELYTGLLPGKFAEFLVVLPNRTDLHASLEGNVLTSISKRFPIILKICRNSTLNIPTNYVKGFRVFG